MVAALALGFVPPWSSSLVGHCFHGGMATHAIHALAEMDIAQAVRPLARMAGIAGHIVKQGEDIIHSPSVSAMHGPRQRRHPCLPQTECAQRRLLVAAGAKDGCLVLKIGVMKQVVGYEYTRRSVAAIVAQVAANLPRYGNDRLGMSLLILLK